MVVNVELQDATETLIEDSVCKFMVRSPLAVPKVIYVICADVYRTYILFDHT